MKVCPIGLLRNIIIFSWHANWPPADKPGKDRINVGFMLHSYYKTISSFRINWQTTPLSCRLRGIINQNNRMVWGWGVIPAQGEQIFQFVSQRVKNSSGLFNFSSGITVLPLRLSVISHEKIRCFTSKDKWSDIPDNDFYTDYLSLLIVQAAFLVGQ